MYQMTRDTSVPITGLTFSPPHLSLLFFQHLLSETIISDQFLKLKIRKIFFCSSYSFSILQLVTKQTLSISSSSLVSISFCPSSMDSWYEPWIISLIQASCISSLLVSYGASKLIVLKFKSNFLTKFPFAFSVSFKKEFKMFIVIHNAFSNLFSKCWGPSYYVWGIHLQKKDTKSQSS